MLTENDLREQIVSVARVCAEKNLLTSSDGNISVRLEDDRFLITPSGVYKMWLRPGDLIIVDASGALIAGPPGLHPTSETRMHMEVYRQRDDVSAVLHAHPPHAVALTIAGIPFPVDLIPEVLLALGDVPTARYATPGTEDLAASIGEMIREHDAVLLSHHGSLTAGKTLVQALIALERLEAAARAYWLANALGALYPLPPDEVARLREIGIRLRSGV
ncbi:MAG: class II aldolase/adducin family protein [Anaerolineae bacterium]|nr:class II aldolase/adducin family protein [Anaerolineae bacterium]